MSDLRSQMQQLDIIRKGWMRTGLFFSIVTFIIGYFAGIATR